MGCSACQKKICLKCGHKLRPVPGQPGKFQCLCQKYNCEEREQSPFERKMMARLNKKRS